ncbi:MAG: hypothetical protein GX921_08185 [Bacteroidales bacterium]|nr:hypothetical protein [Bacteroidales bacterium]
MIDVNAVVSPLLKQTGVEVFFRYPNTFTNTPCISFYTLTDTQGFGADNEEWAQLTRVQVDVWAERAKDTSALGIKVNEIMQSDGWRREYAADLPNQNGEFEHKTMRFIKEIYY